MVEKICTKCEGCGQVANDDDETPWKFWADLKPPANLSVLMGLVCPITCPICEGSGKTKADPPHDPEEG